MKLAKVSLAAVVALGALSTASMAKDLSEAIKGVDVSGYMRYRFNQANQENTGFVADNDQSGKQQNGGTNGDDNHEWKTVMNFKVPTSEQFTAVVGLQYVNKTNTDGSNDANLGSGASGTDTDEDVAVRQWYGAWTPNGTKTTVQVGKMALNTPVSDGGKDRATGILALNSDVENVTFVAGAFDTWYADSFNINTFGGTGNHVGGGAATSLGTLTNDSFNKSMYAIAAIGNYEGLAAQAWFFNITDMVDELYVLDLAYDMKMSDDMGFGIAGQYYGNNLATGDNSVTKLFGEEGAGNNPGLTGYAAPGFSTNAGGLTGNVLNDEYELYNLELRGHYSIVSGKVGYNGSGDKGYFVQLDEEAKHLNYAGEKLGVASGVGTSGASLGALGFNAVTPGAAATSSGKNELTQWYVAAMVDTTWENTAVGVDYVNAEWKKRNGGDLSDLINGGYVTNPGAIVDKDYKIKGEEWVLRAQWKPADAWNLHTYYSMMQQKSDDLHNNPQVLPGYSYKNYDQNFWRVEAKYSF